MQVLPLMLSALSKTRNKEQRYEYCPRDQKRSPIAGLCRPAKHGGDDQRQQDMGSYVSEEFATRKRIGGSSNDDESATQRYGK